MLSNHNESKHFVSTPNISNKRESGQNILVVKDPTCTCHGSSHGHRRRCQTLLQYRNAPVPETVKLNHKTLQYPSAKSGGIILSRCNDPRIGQFFDLFFSFWAFSWPIYIKSNITTFFLESAWNLFVRSLSEKPHFRIWSDLIGVVHMPANDST